MSISGPLGLAGVSRKNSIFYAIFPSKFKESQTNDRYNRDDPCLAVEQIFLGFKRWFQIYTKDCKKSTIEKQLRYSAAKTKGLNRTRNKIFVKMQCEKYIKKYDLGTGKYLNF